MTVLVILVRVVAAFWLLNVFYQYAWHAYRLARTDPAATGAVAFGFCVLALLIIAGWWP